MDPLLTKSKTSCPIDTSCENDNITSSDFDCCICYQVPIDPVLTPCGHLFCWPCLYTWLHSFSQSKQCPFCKSHIKEKKLVPIFGKGRSKSSSTSDFINNIPNRPIVRRIRVSSQRTHRNSSSEIMIPRLSIFGFILRFAIVNGLIGVLMLGYSALCFHRSHAEITLSSSSIKSGAIGAKMSSDRRTFSMGYNVGFQVAVLVMVIWTCGRRDLLAMLRMSRLLALLMALVIAMLVLLVRVSFFNVG